MTDVRSIISTVAGQAELVIDSNITPSMTFNLANILIPGTPSEAIQSDHSLLLRLIRPEIVIKTLGMEKSYAPYGKPWTGMYIILGISIAAAGLLGAGISWFICHNYVG